MVNNHQFVNKCNFALMKIGILSLLILSIVGGIGMGISFPFTGGLLPLAFVSFVPLLIINFQLNLQKRGRFWLRFGLNYLYFVIFNYITTWWIYYASEPGMFMAVFANSLLMTLPFFIGGFITRQLGEGRGLLAVMVLWMSFEYAHFFWELSWPWLNLGHIIGNTPKLMQWYEYSGVTGGTCWILVINIFVYMIVRNLWIRKESWKIQAPILLFTALGLIIPIISSLVIYYNYEEKKDPVDIVIVQPNIEAHFEKFYTPWNAQLGKMFSLADPQVDENVDLVLCPETAINIGLDEANLYEEQAIKYAQSFQRVKDSVPVLIGAFTQAFFREEHSAASRPLGIHWYEDYNTALMIDPLKPIQSYHKSKLVLGFMFSQLPTN